MTKKKKNLKLNIIKKMIPIPKTPTIVVKQNINHISDLPFYGKITYSDLK